MDFRKICVPFCWFSRLFWGHFCPFLHVFRKHPKDSFEHWYLLLNAGHWTLGWGYWTLLLELKSVRTINTITEGTVQKRPFSTIEYHQLWVWDCGYEVVYYRKWTVSLTTGLVWFSHCDCFHFRIYPLEMRSTPPVYPQQTRLRPPLP